MGGEKGADSEYQQLSTLSSNNDSWREDSGWAIDDQGWIAWALLRTEMRKIPGCGIHLGS
jgi:hypothetical protein